MTDEIKETTPTETVEDANVPDENANAAAELAALKAALAEKARQDAENALLAELYPEVSRASIPEAVEREASEQNMPLAAAYALYLRRCELAAAEAKIAAKLAAAESAGALGGSCGETLYSIDEIRAMSRKEIRRSYKAILRSLERENH